MKFITSKELRNNPSKLWQSVDEETIITVNGKPMAVAVRAVDDIEELLKSIRKAKAQSALEKLRIYSSKQGLNRLTDKEVITEIEKIRTEDRQHDPKAAGYNPPPAAPFVLRSRHTKLNPKSKHKA